MKNESISGTGAATTTGAADAQLDEEPRPGPMDALRAAWASSGGLAGVVVTSAPTVVFVATSALGGLDAAIVAATVLPADHDRAEADQEDRRRPLTGLLLNRLAGGPRDWRHRRDLLRVYDVTTLVAVAVNAVNFALQATFYAADQPAVLAAAHIATGPVFALLVAATLVAVRRRLGRDRAVRSGS